MSRSRRRVSRRGLTLLEVVLALAILATSMAVLGQLVRLGARAAASARDVSRAQLLCESIMSEVVAGAIPAQSAQQAAIETNPDWLYSVAVTTTNVYGVISVSVTVQRNESSARPARATLVRWMRDPALATADDTTAGATGSSL